MLNFLQAMGIQIFLRAALCLLLLVFSQCPAVLARTCNITLKIGAISNSTNTRTPQIFSAYKLAVNQFLADESKLPGVCVTIVTADSAGGQGAALFEVTRLVQSDKIVALFGDLGSDLTVNEALMTGVLKIPQVAYSAGSEKLGNKVDYPYFWRTIAPASQSFTGALGMLEYFKWSRVVLMNSVDALGGPAGEVVRQDLGSRKDLTLLASIPIFKDNTDSDVDSGLEEVKAKHARVIMTIMTAQQTSTLLLHAIAKKMTGPDYIWININPYADQAGATTVNELRKNYGDEFVDYHMRGTILLAGSSDVIPGYPPNDDFMALWKNLDPVQYPGVVKGQPPLRYIVRAYSSVYVYLLGIHNATFGPNPTTTIQAVAAGTAGDKVKPAAFANTGFVGPLGPITLNEKGDSVDRVDYHIYVANGSTIRFGIGEHGEFNRTLDVIPWKVAMGANFGAPDTPAPVDFIYYEIYIGWDGTGTGIIAIFMLLLLINCIIGAYLAVNVNSGPVKAASPMFLSLMWMGYALACITPIFRVGKPSDLSCRSTYWIEVIAFSLVMAPLAIKTFRIWRIFDNRQAKMLRLSNKVLLPIVAGIISVNVILLIVATTAGGLGPTVDYDDAAATAVFDCGSTNGKQGILSGIGAALVVYNGILVLVCTFFAYKTRGIVARFSESGYIGISVYTILLCSIFILVIDNIPGTTAKIHFLIREILVFIMLATSIGALLGKVVFMNVFTAEKDSSAPGRSSKESGANSNHPFTDNSANKPSQTTSSASTITGTKMNVVAQEFSIITLNKWINKWETATLILPLDPGFGYLMLKIGDKSLYMDLKEIVCSDVEEHRQSFKLADNQGNSFRVQARSPAEKESWLRHLVELSAAKSRSTVGLISKSTTGALV
ncbi:hypothetical protein HK104_007701 [Borealophlyctis nickersoniae]|nr:hypothetical protein HK104_007701 [Borealophlyctis nickersoniae]